jgi:pimeloyl-ACP methyl ester carboxylesterase
MNQIFKNLGLAVLLIVALLLLILGLNAITFTPPILTEHSIAVRKTWNINGIDQWVLIRGHNKIDNPLLFILHGGPGMPSNGTVRLQNSELEKHFTVIYWEQRGSGYSFHKEMQEEQLKSEYFVEDLKILIKMVQSEVNADVPVYILGHSWGSIIGLRFAVAYPELLDLYIGVGQVTHDVRAETVSRNFALEKAWADGNSQAVKELEDIGLPPYDYDKLMIKSRWVSYYGAYGSHSNDSVTVRYLKMLRAFEFGWPYLIKLNKGAYFSLRVLQGEIASVNFFEEIPELKVPLVFLEGRNDYAVPVELAEEYFEFLKAPEKTLHIFEGSGHSPQRDEPEAFNNFIISLKNRY